MEQNSFAYDGSKIPSPSAKGRDCAIYIHQHICISPQHTSDTIDLDKVEHSEEGKLAALEPTLEGVPPGMIRRMSKAVRMGLGAGLPIVAGNRIDGIIIGTANGGMDDCIKFLNQIIDYDEGLLTPGSFVQSTPNAIAGQLSLITKNHHYNATHVHLGLAFENALIDAKMLLGDNPGAQYLVGAVDEISTYNYNIDYLAGWYDKTIESENLYNTNLPATIAGEGAAMFLVSHEPENAIAKIAAIESLHTTDLNTVKDRFKDFLAKQKIDASKTVYVSGENGDTRLNPFYAACEDLMKESPIIRYKHLTGEYPTASSFATWLASFILQNQSAPNSLYKNNSRPNQIEDVVLYNNYHGIQHSFLLLSMVK